MIAVVVLVVIFALIGEYLKSAYSSIPTPTGVKAPPTSLYSGLVSQQLLFYSNGQYIVPYALMSFLSSNSPEVYFNASLLSVPPPSGIYMLNYSSCYDCGNLAAFEGDLGGYLEKYNISGYNNISLVSQRGLLSIKNNSILIIPTGIMPAFMLGNVNGTNATYVQALLNKGVSIIYIGQSFSSLLLPNGIVIPNSNIPPFLITSSASPSNNSAGFHFTNQTFAFDAGSRYGSISYENEYNGSVVAFSNYLNTWPSESDAAYDVARAVAEGFWLPKYLSASYSTAANPYTSTSGRAGLIFNSSTVTFSQANINKLNSGALRIVVYNSKNYSVSNNSRYLYLTYTPDYAINGTLSIPTSISPGSSFEAAIVIFTHSAVPIGVQPHITIYKHYDALCSKHDRAQICKRSRKLFVSAVPEARHRAGRLYSGGAKLLRHTLFVSTVFCPANKHSSYALKLHKQQLPIQPDQPRRTSLRHTIYHIPERNIPGERHNTERHNIILTSARHTAVLRQSEFQDRNALDQFHIHCSASFTHHINTV